MPSKMPKTAALAAEIDKLTDAIEGDAQKRLDRIEGLHAKRRLVFGKADERLDARDASLDEADAALEALDAAMGDNGAPTSSSSENSSQG